MGHGQCWAASGMWLVAYACGPGVIIEEGERPYFDPQPRCLSCEAHFLPSTSTTPTGEPRVSVRPTELAFYTVYGSDEAEITQQVALHNGLEQSIWLMRVTIGDDLEVAGTAGDEYFVVTGPAEPKLIAPDGGVELTVRFLGAAHQQWAVLRLETSVDTEPLVVSLTGKTFYE